jgi:hypothetical protein
MLNERALLHASYMITRSILHYWAYEIEFVNPDGSTRALLTLTPEQARKLESTDVLTTRPLALAT